MAAMLLTSHSLSHTHTHTQLATGGTGKFTQLLTAPTPSPIIASVSLPACQTTPSLRQTLPLFILPADSGSTHNEDLSDKKGSYSTGWRDCGRRERERNVIFEWLIKKRNRWEQSLSRRDRKKGLGITEQAAR